MCPEGHLTMFPPGGQLMFPPGRPLLFLPGSTCCNLSFSILALAFFLAFLLALLLALLCFRSVRLFFFLKRFRSVRLFFFLKLTIGSSLMLPSLEEKPGSASVFILPTGPLQSSGSVLTCSALILLHSNGSLSGFISRREL